MRCSGRVPCFRDNKVVAGRLEARRAGRAKLAPEDLVEAAVRGLAQARPGIAVWHHLHPWRHDIDQQLLCPSGQGCPSRVASCHPGTVPGGSAFSTQSSAGEQLMTNALPRHIDSMIRKVLSLVLYPRRSSPVYVGACGTLPCYCCSSCQNTWHLQPSPSHTLPCNRAACADHQDMSSPGHSGGLHLYDAALVCRGQDAVRSKVQGQPGLLQCVLQQADLRSNGHTCW